MISGESPCKSPPDHPYEKYKKEGRKTDVICFSAFSFSDRQKYRSVNLVFSYMISMFMSIVYFFLFVKPPFHFFLAIFLELAGTAGHFHHFYCNHLHNPV